MIAEEPQENYGTGWIKLFRSVKNKVWFKKPDYLAVWVYMLLKANHKDGEWIYKGEKITVKRGQFITSRKSISAETGVQQMKVERILNYFKTEQQIEQQNMFTSRLITIVSYEDYQSSEQQNEHQMNSKRTANEQQMNTNKNVKKGKNVKEIKEAVDLIWNEPEFEIAWNKWKEYKQAEKKQKYKTVMSENQAIKNLHSMSSGELITAIKIINQSVGHGWSGLFPLKNGAQNSSTHEFVDEYHAKRVAQVLAEQGKNKTND